MADVPVEALVPSFVGFEPLPDGVVGVFGTPPDDEPSGVVTGSAAQAARVSETAISERIRTGYERFNPESEMRT